MTLPIKGLELVGEGHHGKVYRLDNSSCIKVYKRKSFMQMEYQVLKHSESFPYFPKVYECRENYMIREYIDGTGLWDYLQQYGLSKNLAIQMLEILDSFMALGYTKLDFHLHHILVTEGERLKMIDPTTNMSRKSSYPATLLKQLGQLNFLDQFLAYTKEARPEYYEKWCSHR